MYTYIVIDDESLIRKGTIKKLQPMEDLSLIHISFGKKKESREVEGYMKLTPKSALIYLAIIVFCIIVISPLVIVFSSSLRSPGNQASPLMLFSEFTLASYKQAFSNMSYPMELINSILTTGGSVLCVVIFATMAAYPIGRIKTKTAKFLYYFFISDVYKRQPLRCSSSI